MRTWLALALVLAACKGKDTPPSSNATSGSAAAVATPTGDDPWAEQKPRPLPPPDVTDPFPRPLFWSASKDGKTTHLFGTLHGGVDAERRIPTWVWKHFEDATTVIEEVNLQAIELQRWTLRPAGPTLREELGDAYWAKFSTMVTPIVANLLDTQSTAAAGVRASGYGGGGEEAAPMDGALLVRAQGLGKRIVFLETPAIQSDNLASLWTLDMLKRTIDHREELAPLNPAFMSAYNEGAELDLVQLARAQFRLAVADDASLERLYEKLIYARNRTWIAKLEQEHANGGVFVAVGALHLTGERSVLELLRARGFTVQRISAP